MFCDSHVPIDFIQERHCAVPTEKQIRDAEFRHIAMKSDRDMISNDISSDAELQINLRLHNKDLYSVNALVDSGSDFSYICSDTLQHLQKLGGLLRSSVIDYPRSFTGVTGTRGTIQDCLVTGIYLSQHHYAVATLHVVDANHFIFFWVVISC